MWINIRIEIRMGLRISLFKGEYLRDKDDLRKQDKDKHADENHDNDNDGSKNEV